MGFRDMQEQNTFHAGREYERKILAKRIKELEGVFGLDNPWSLLTCAKQLVIAASHLLNDHNCDMQCERTEIAKRQMQKYITKIEQTLKG